MLKIFVTLGGLNAFLAVALGAFGAHGLKGEIPDEMLEIYQTGVQYQMIHAIGLVIVALLSVPLGDRRWLRWSGGLMQAGIALFSGSLYTLSLSGISAFGAVAPFGGVSFLAAWALLAAAAWKRP